MAGTPPVDRAVAEGTASVAYLDVLTPGFNRDESLFDLLRLDDSGAKNPGGLCPLRSAVLRGWIALSAQSHPCRCGRESKPGPVTTTGIPRNQIGVDNSFGRYSIEYVALASDGSNIDVSG